MIKMGIALQLYTVRDMAGKDFAGTIKAVSRVGYENVEMAGFGNLKSAAEVRKALDDHGVRAIANHASLEPLENDLARLLDESDALGAKYVVLSWMPEDRRTDAAGWKAVAGVLGGIGAQCQKRSFDLAYHNHSFEFQTFDGKPGLDIFFENADAKLVKSELDTYWVRHGGQDPVAYINKLSSRLPLLHLKDMAPGHDKRFAPVGTGLLDFKAILAAAERAGTKWGIVEQDTTYETAPLDAIKASFENLQKLGAV